MKGEADGVVKVVETLETMLAFVQPADGMALGKWKCRK